MDTVVVQKSLVVNNRGEILILRRSESDTRRPLQWDLPGGQLEPGENLIDGVKREVLEETGLAVGDIHVVYSKTEHRTWKEGEASVVFLLYAAHAQSDVVTISHEHDQFAWKTIQDALPLFEYPLHLEFLAYVLKNQIAI
jgi:8-oxo-dGTP pyrophosphatase MutT (NUDIX family)